jgi:hypothetical protein
MVKFKNFEVGDKVKIGDRSKFKELIGLEGVIVLKNPQKKSLGIDFEKDISDYRSFKTHNLNGFLDNETGFYFYDLGWIGSKIDPSFDIRNLTII